MATPTPFDHQLPVFGAIRARDPDMRPKADFFFDQVESHLQPRRSNPERGERRAKRPRRRLPTSRSKHRNEAHEADPKSQSPISPARHQGEP